MFMNVSGSIARDGLERASRQKSRYPAPVMFFDADRPEACRCVVAQTSASRGVILTVAARALIIGLRYGLPPYFAR
jgi:hypothetical protein